MKFFVVVILAAATTVNALIFGPTQDWDGLRVTWGLNPFNPYTFARIPRTVTEALAEGWHLETAASSNNFFCGARYIKYDSELGADDTAVMPIYDRNGYIAGIANGIPLNTDVSWYPSVYTQPPFIREDAKRIYTHTAYFSSPEIVCGAGRPQGLFEAEGTGNNLFILMGNRTRTVLMPYYEKDVSLGSTTRLVKGECFYTMGQHYWEEIYEFMPCDEFMPGFLMYNGGRLNAFGLAFLGNMPGPRYEHPSFSDLGSVMKKVPWCLQNYNHLSAIHIYMDDSPRTNTC